MIYTFWEGPMPDYIKACLSTWKLPYILLNYDNINNYIDFPKNKLSHFTLPIIADYVRVHILEKYGGYWLDADTIMLSNKLPTYNVLGYPETRGHHIGYLYTEPHSEMFIKWKEYQDSVIDTKNYSWNIMGNAFTDSYVKEHSEITIGDVHNYTPEVYMIESGDRMFKYREFYFNKSFKLNDLQRTEFFMLHNSWTPNFYKAQNFLNYNCTLTNILTSLKGK